MVHIQGSSFDYFKSKVQHQLSDLLKTKDIDLIFIKNTDGDYSVKIFSTSGKTCMYAGCVGISKVTYKPSGYAVSDLYGSSIIMDYRYWVFTNVEKNENEAETLYKRYLKPKYPVFGGFSEVLYSTLVILMREVNNG